MAGDDDSVTQAGSALCVKDQPAAEALEAAPILDRWECFHPFRDVTKGVAAKGVVCGSPRFADGTAIFTSALRAVDGFDDGQPDWVRTQNTLYRLGWQNDPLPPVLQVALASTWGA